MLEKAHELLKIHNEMGIRFYFQVSVGNVANIFKRKFWRYPSSEEWNIINLDIARVNVNLVDHMSKLGMNIKPERNPALVSDESEKPYIIFGGNGHMPWNGGGLYFINHHQKSKSHGKVGGDLKMRLLKGLSDVCKDIFELEFYFDLKKEAAEDLKNRLGVNRNE